MKKNILKMVSCIVLSTVMVLVGVLPSMASGSDDLTGWNYGTNNTITGNPTDGWDLTLSAWNPWGGVEDGVGTYAAYEFDGLASELQMTMDISGLEDGKDLWFVLAGQTISIYQWSWDGTNMAVCFKRIGNLLDIYGHRGNAETTHAQFADFDFTAPHVIEFLQDSNGEYHLALDGVLCLLPWEAGATCGSVDDYVTIGGEEDSVVVSFGATAATIKDLKISKKGTSTEEPTEVPTEEPTEEPTEVPTEVPTKAPVEDSTEMPTEAPSADIDASTGNQKDKTNNAAGIIIGIVIAVVVLAAVVSIVLIKKKKK